MVSFLLLLVFCFFSKKSIRESSDTSLTSIGAWSYNSYVRHLKCSVGKLLNGEQEGDLSAGTTSASSWVNLCQLSNVSGT